MEAKELLEHFQRRLERKKTFALGLLFSGPVFCVAALIFILSQARFEKVWPVVAAIAAALLLLLVLTKFIAKKIAAFDPAVSAAQCLDLGFKAKDRFLSLRELNDNSSAEITAKRELILKQLSSLVTEVGEQQLTVPKLLPKKFSYLPALSFLIGVILLASIKYVLPKPIKHFEFSKEVELALTDLERLAETSNELPQSTKEEIADLQETIAENGIHSEESLEKLEKVEQSLSAAETNAQPKELQSLDKKQSSETKKNDLGLGSDSNQKDAEPATEQQPSTEKKETLAQKEQNPTTEDKQKSEQLQSSAAESKEQKQEGSGTEKSAANKGSAAQSGQEQQSNSKQNRQEGEKSAEQKGSSEQSKEGTDKQQPKNDKVGETGVGDGKGKGNTDSNAKQKSEATSGSNSQGAKEGAAESPSGDSRQEGNQSSEQKAEKKEDQSKQGNSTAAAKPKEQGKNNQGEDGKPNSDIQKAKADVQNLKSEVQGKDTKAGQQGDKGSKQSSDGKRSEEKKGQQQGQSGSQSASKQSENKQGEGKQGENKDSESKNKTEEKGNNKNSQSGQQKSATQGNQQKDGQQSDNSGQQSAASEKGNSQQTDKKDGDKNSGNQGKGSMSENSGGEKGNASSGESGDNRGSKTPQTISGENGNGAAAGNGHADQIFKDGETIKKETVTLTPTDEKVETKDLGSSDHKRYLNENPAQAKTKLTTDEFKKPEADVTTIRQPIPAEYLGVIGR